MTAEEQRTFVYSLLTQWAEDGGASPGQLLKFRDSIDQVLGLLSQVMEVNEGDLRDLRERTCANERKLERIKKRYEHEYRASRN